MGDKMGFDTSSIVAPPQEPKYGLPITNLPEDGAISDFAFQGGGRSTGGAGTGY